MRYLIVLVGLVVAACAYQTDVVSNEPDSIVIRAGQYVSGGEILKQAQAHCAKINRRAVFQSASGGLYRYVCE